MISSQRKKRLYLAVGLMFALILGLLFHAGQFMQGTRSARKPDQGPDGSERALPMQPAVIVRKISMPGPGEAHAAETGQPALVRKKLPAPLPAAAPTAEPLPAQPAAATEPSTIGEEKPKEPTPPAAVSLPELTPMPPPAVAPVAKPEPSKPEPKPITVSRAAHPFSLLLSSCKEKENAFGALAGYRQMGLKPYVVQTDLGGKGQWWRTLTGHFRTSAEAAQAKTALRLPNAVVVKTPYANLIGEYGSESEAVEAAAQVAHKEVFAYMVKGSENSFQLMTGAFPSPQAAEIHRRELEAKGVSTRTVQR